MNVSHTPQGNNKVPMGDQHGIDHQDAAEERSEEERPQAAGQHSVAWAVAVTAWAAACAFSTIAWAIITYFIVREKQRARVELARLELEAKRGAGKAV